MRLELALIVGIVFFCCWCAYIVAKMSGQPPPPPPSTPSAAVQSSARQPSLAAHEQQQQQAAPAEPGGQQGQPAPTSAASKQFRFQPNRIPEENSPQLYVVGAPSPQQRQQVSPQTARPASPPVAPGWPPQASWQSAPGADQPQLGPPREAGGGAHLPVPSSWQLRADGDALAGRRAQLPRLLRSPYSGLPPFQLAPGGDPNYPAAPALADTEQEPQWHATPESEEGAAPGEEGEELAPEVAAAAGESPVNSELEEQAGRRSFSEDLADQSERDRDGRLVVTRRRHLINGRPVASNAADSGAASRGRGRRGRQQLAPRAVGFEKLVREIDNEDEGGGPAAADEADEGEPEAGADYDESEEGAGAGRARREEPDERQQRPEDDGEEAEQLQPATQEYAGGESRLRASAVAPSQPVLGPKIAAAAASGSERPEEAPSRPRPVEPADEEADEDEDQERAVGASSRDSEPPKSKRDSHRHRLSETLSAQQWDDDSSTARQSAGAAPAPEVAPVPSASSAGQHQLTPPPEGGNEHEEPGGERGAGDGDEGGLPDRSAGAASARLVSSEIDRELEALEPLGGPLLAPGAGPVKRQKRQLSDASLQTHGARDLADSDGRATASAPSVGAPEFGAAGSNRFDDLGPLGHSDARGPEDSLAVAIESGVIAAASRVAAGAERRRQEGPAHGGSAEAELASDIKVDVTLPPTTLALAAGDAFSAPLAHYTNGQPPMLPSQQQHFAGPFDGHLSAGAANADHQLQLQRPHVHTEQLNTSAIAVQFEAPPPEAVGAYGLRGGADTPAGRRPPAIYRQPGYRVVSANYPSAASGPKRSYAKKSKAKSAKRARFKKSRVHESKQRGARAHSLKKASKHKQGETRHKKLLAKKKFAKSAKQFAGSAHGHKAAKGAGEKGAKKGALYYKDKGYKKRGFKKNYQKTESGDHKTYFDEFRDKDHNKKWKEFEDKHHYSHGKKWAAKDSKKYKDFKAKEMKDKKSGQGDWRHKESSKYRKDYKYKSSGAKRRKKKAKKKKRSSKSSKDTNKSHDHVGFAASAA